jgi:hypothetical protein
MQNMNLDQSHFMSNVMAVDDVLYVRMLNVRKSGWVR